MITLTRMGMVVAAALLTWVFFWPREIVVSAALAMIAAGILLAFVRIARGPTMPDRIVALDLLSAQAIGLIALIAVGMDLPILLDIGLLVALVSFLGTVAFAKYLEKRI